MVPLNLGNPYIVFLIGTSEKGPVTLQASRIILSLVSANLKTSHAFGGSFCVVVSNGLTKYP